MYWHVYQNNKLCIKQNQNIVPSQNKDNNFQDPTWTILFDVHLLRLVASSSPLLPEWGKHMARNPEKISTFIPSYFDTMFLLRVKRD